MPLIVVFSRYSLKMMFLGGLAIFTIKFWSTMWFIARWMDDHLIKAMYPDSNVLMEAITTGLDGSIKRTTLNIVLLSMYAGLPLIWSGMMGWIGLSIGKGIESLKESSLILLARQAKKEWMFAKKAVKSIKSRVAGPSNCITSPLVLVMSGSNCPTEVRPTTGELPESNLRPHRLHITLGAVWSIKYEKECRATKNAASSVLALRKILKFQSYCNP